MTGKYCSKFLSKMYGVTLPSIIAYIGILRPEKKFNNTCVCNLKFKKISKRFNNICTKILIHHTFML